MKVAAQHRQVKIDQLAEVDAVAAGRLRALRRSIFIPRPAEVPGSALAGLVGVTAAHNLARRFARSTVEV